MYVSVNGIPLGTFIAYGAYFLEGWFTNGCAWIDLWVGEETGGTPYFIVDCGAGVFERGETAYCDVSASSGSITSASYTFSGDWNTSGSVPSNGFCLGERNMLNKTLVGIALASALALPAPAQIVVTAAPKWEDSSAGAIVARFQNSSTRLAEILRQTTMSQPRAKLDRIADSLVRIAAIDLPAGSSVSAASGHWFRAVTALAAAGRPATDAHRGTPYPGAFDRLLRVYRESPEGSYVREIVAGLVMGTGPQEAALGFLRTVATSTDRSALDAMMALVNEVNPKSIRYRETTAQEHARSEALLKELWRTFRREVDSLDRVAARSDGGIRLPATEWKARSIPRRDAAMDLASFAQRNGWSQ